MGKVNQKLWLEISPGYFVKVDSTLQKHSGKTIRKWKPKTKKLGLNAARSLALKLLRQRPK